MTPDACRLMADYNRWINARLYEAAARLPEPQLMAERGAFFGSLFATLNHIAVADTLWLHRFAGLPGYGWLAECMQPFPKPTSLTERLADALAPLADYRRRADAVIDAFAAQLTADDLGQVLRYHSTDGRAQAKRFAPLLQHFFNHQTHHRGQASTLLFQAGVDVGVTDLVALVPAEPG
jgi:uncharacterized damage-inducible protein DinB